MEMRFRDNEYGERIWKKLQQVVLCGNGRWTKWPFREETNIKRWYLVFIRDCVDSLLHRLLGRSDSHTFNEQQNQPPQIGLGSDNVHQFVKQHDLPVGRDVGDGIHKDPQYCRHHVLWLDLFGCSIRLGWSGSSDHLVPALLFTSLDVRNTERHIFQLTVTKTLWLFYFTNERSLVSLQTTKINWAIIIFISCYLPGKCNWSSFKILFDLFLRVIVAYKCNINYHVWCLPTILL